ncbi:MAG TPA: SPASM domain-containing protein, partial [Bacteroidales bacterium]|nr:SPASM domain-containing protein [Bacteroidales bacterium]
PPVSYEDFLEAPENLGCMMAGNTLLYINSRGDVQPCVVLPVTFGNISNEDFPVILRRMREVITLPVRTACPSLILNKRIRALIEIGKTLPVSYEELADDFKYLRSSPEKEAKQAEVI